jgi:hypothetical protein
MYRRFAVAFLWRTLALDLLACLTFRLGLTTHWFMTHASGPSRL